MSDLKNIKQIVIFTLNNMGNLGYFPECKVIDTDDEGIFSTHYVKVTPQNKSNYNHLFDKTDEVLFDLCTKLDKDIIVSKVKGRKISNWENIVEIYFHAKSLNKEDKFIKDYLIDYIEKNQRDFFERICDKPLYLAISRFPFSWLKLTIEDELLELYYCYDNQLNDLKYTLDVRYKSKPISLLNATLISRKPARILLKNKIYEFEEEIDGQKLTPFFTKKSLTIPLQSKEEYIQKVILPFISTNRIINKGFEIQTITKITNALLKIKEVAPVRQISLFDNEENDISQKSIVIELIFEYNSFLYWAGQNGTTTKLEMTADTFIIYKVERDFDSETLYINALNEIGIDLNGKVITRPYSEGIDWLNDNYKAIESTGVDIKFEKRAGENQPIFVGERTLTLVLEEAKDWFSISGKVKFGDYEIPFVRILNYIRQDKHQMTLPGGEYVQIPQSWFDEYKTLIDLCKIEEGNVKIAKHYCAMINKLYNKPQVQLSFRENMQRLLEHKLEKNFDMPTNYNGELRHYQQEGYNWLRLLDDLALGGCLADDMGLGKTIQTLFLMQWMKENNRGMSLLVVPTSLIYNWEQEAAKFTPHLKVHVHTGNQRTRQIDELKDVDILLTSYGIMRRDKHLLSSIQFNYIILDEAQAIKNPQSDTTQVCLSLKASRFLTLTGTPIENSLTDLWSQVHFFNRNMLGSQNYFVRDCKLPQRQELYRQLLKPFLLRRNKSEVLTELPEKTIVTQWCDMTDEQTKFYRNLRNSYRDKFLENKDVNNKINPMILLEGLLRLRQAANHPILNDSEYIDDSGKFDTACQMLDEVIAQNDKVLVFSSFVEHLKLYRNYLDENRIQYCYLDGKTKDRKAEVERFQNNHDTKVFLLSLKAGGVGLNLTSASYVFLLDPWWNPAAEAQAYDRAHRIGQKNKVFVYKFISRYSIEEKIIKLQQEKLQLFNTMINVDNDILKNLDVNEVMSLLD